MGHLNLLGSRIFKTLSTMYAHGTSTTVFRYGLTLIELWLMLGIGTVVGPYVTALLFL